MADYELEAQKQGYALDRQRNASVLRSEERQTVAVYDAETERLRGHNERELARLVHELEIDNRAHDLKYAELNGILNLRLDAVRIFLEQQDAFTRWLWEQEDRIRSFEREVSLKWIDAQIASQFSRQEHDQGLDSKTHDTDEDIRKYRALAEINREFGKLSTDEMATEYEKLKQRGMLD